LLGIPCDGADGDLCVEGATVCNAAGNGTTCSDRSGTNVEICDGLDNNCDGSVDEGFPTPGQVDQLSFSSDTQNLSWASVPFADSYDLVKGGLMPLHSSGGDFTNSLLGCLENDGADTVATDPTVPAVGQGLFYLVRAKAACKTGTYNSGQPGQQGDRDPKVAASPVTCP
jgi:hypothetical protein